MVLEFQNIHVQYGKKEILHGVDLGIEKGQITGVVGPNGCGKSTLIKTVFGIAPVAEGTIRINGKDTREMKRREISESLGYVGQDTVSVFDFTVEEIIGMALYNKKMKRQEASSVIRSAMKELEITQFAGRSIQTLSGGERKMVFLARAIAQGSDTIILDEPTNHLDIRNQLFLLNYLRKSGKTVLLVIHDLRLGAHFCDRLYLMKDGSVICSGSAQEVLSEEHLKSVFGISGYVHEDETKGKDFYLSFQ